MRIISILIAFSVFSVSCTDLSKKIEVPDGDAAVNDEKSDLNIESDEESDEDIISVIDDDVDDQIPDDETFNFCRDLNPVECSQSADCKGVSARRFRWGDKTYLNRGNCIEDREWVGCFSIDEVSCTNSGSGYSMVDTNGQCWISDGCDPLSWKKPEPNDPYCYSEEEGTSWPEMQNCGTRFCDDGSDLTCKMGMPWYCEPETAIVALQDGCWVCVEPISCKLPGEDHCDSSNVCSTNADCPSGYSCTAMLSCNNSEWGACEPHQCLTQSEEALTCRAVKPDCGNGVPVINNGCWECVDIVSCLPL